LTSETFSPSLTTPAKQLIGSPFLLTSASDNPLVRTEESAGRSLGLSSSACAIQTSPIIMVASAPDFVTSSASFLFCPKQYAHTQSVRLHKPFHKSYLVETYFEEEACEFSQRLFTQITPTVEIIAASEIACSQVRLICFHIACQASRHRPNTAGIERIQQHAMRHQSRHPTVAVEKRMNPIIAGGIGKPC
jgi:hypothetical protein